MQPRERAQHENVKLYMNRSPIRYGVLLLSYYDNNIICACSTSRCVSGVCCKFRVAGGRGGRVSRVYIRMCINDVGRVYSDNTRGNDIMPGLCARRRNSEPLRERNYRQGCTYLPSLRDLPRAFRCSASLRDFAYPRYVKGCAHTIICGDGVSGCYAFRVCRASSRRIFLATAESLRL